MTASAPPPNEQPVRAERWLREVRARVETVLDEVLPPIDGPQRHLAEAMRYSVEAGGKRLRPALALATCEACGGRPEAALGFAAALELLHTYSLIHDDLPAMDDDDLRRGRPTSHKVFGEALAILAGDALHTLAFETVLARSEPAEAARRAALELARAAGASGMVGGQVEDIESVGCAPDEEALLRLQAAKTGALLASACRGGAILAQASDDDVERVGRYGRHLGLAFQVVDDVLDATSTAEVLGKATGRDEEEHRMTWVALEGVERARARANREIEAAVAAIRGLGERDVLEALARYVTSRVR